ncbi:MAG: nucleotide sugar dehydrogenase [Anaerolineae bacterium]
MSHHDVLLEKIADRTARVAVIGLGYVGLPLAVEFARGGLTVVGIDIDAGKCDAINGGRSYIDDVPSSDLASFVRAGRLSATTDWSALDDADAAIICVPTPLNKTKDPDISFIIAAADKLAEHMHDAMLVVLESTTYPGTTTEILLPRIKQNGYTVGQDFFLAFSPERVDPGNKTWNTRNTPKVLGGMTPPCTEVASALYGCAVETIVPVSSPATAEMVKILENTFRAVNIGLANEMAQICQRMGLDIWEVIAAAKTKPFGFMPFYPGPGLGGHCIPIDPLYLSWKARGMGVETRFIELADFVNSAMPRYWVGRIQDALNERGKPLQGSRVLVLGVAYKADVSDLRETPALEIIDELRARGAEVAYHDPHAPKLKLRDGDVLESVSLTEDALREADCVFVHTAHARIDWGMVRDAAVCLVDSRGIVEQHGGKAGHDA